MTTKTSEYFSGEEDNDYAPDDSFAKGDGFELVCQFCGAGEKEDKVAYVEATPCCKRCKLIYGQAIRDDAKEGDF